MAKPKFDDQISRFIRRGRRKNPNAASGYQPVKRGTPAARPVKRSAKGY